MKKIMFILLFTFAFGADRSLLEIDEANLGRRRLMQKHTLKKTVMVITSILIGIAVTLAIYYSQTLFSTKYWLDFWEILMPYFQQFWSILGSPITMVRDYVPWIFQTTIDWIIYGFKSIIEIPNVIFALLSKFVSFLNVIVQVLLQILVKIPGAFQLFGNLLLQLFSSIVNFLPQMMNFLWILFRKIPGALQVFGNLILQLLSSIVSFLPQVMNFLWILLQKIPGVFQVFGNLIFQLFSFLWRFIIYIPQYSATGIAAVIQSFFWLSVQFWNGVIWSHQIWAWISGDLIYLWGAFFHNLLYYFGWLTSEFVGVFTTLIPQFARYIFHHLSYVFAKSVAEPKASFSIVTGFLTALFLLIRFWK
jgi:hypothetical protein